MLEALAADLRALLKRARQALQEHEEAGLAKRAAAIAGESGSVLRAIEEVTRNRALAEVRPLLAAAIERAASTTFDVGVFGRVSAGKSSLINSLIGDRVLPVGATPVTAVPLRLTRGDAGAVLRLLDGERREIGIGEIAHYATEESNPENRLGIRSIGIRTPSVPPGLCLLDTPGVGSLNVSGPAAAFAWLPRCDLGLVLIAAGTAITHDDLALVTGLHHAGIRCAVLLSKSDLLEADEIERALDYVRRELRTTLGDDASSTMLEIHVVSTMPGNESSLDDFRMRALAPLGLDHARAARRALVSRLHRLADAVARALQAREEVAAKTGVESGGDAPRAEAALAGPDERTMLSHRARARAMATLRAETDRLPGMASEILDTAADAVVRAWAGQRDGVAAARAAIIARASDSLRVVREAVDGVALAGAEEDEGNTEARATEWSRHRRVPPLFDPEILDTLPSMPSPPIARRVVGRKMALHRLETIREPLKAALRRYGSALYEWGRGALDELTMRASDDSWDLANREEESVHTQALLLSPAAEHDFSMIEQALAELDQATVEATVIAIPEACIREAHILRRTCCDAPWAASAIYRRAFRGRARPDAIA
ncbi:MAG: dynamin family protein [Gemmatimonadota bacterium]|nr:dynamin family protein [Gemmatimonadota bacterium]